MVRPKVKPREGLGSRFKDALDVLLYGPFAVLRQIRIQLVLIVAMFGFGTIVFMHYQHLSPLAAFTGSVSTITTIGLYAPNITSMPPLEQVIMVVIFIVSVGLAASLVQSIVTTAVSRETLREQLVVRRVSRLKGHVIVAGSGRLANHTIKWLSNIGVGHVVITTNRDDVRRFIHEGRLTVYGSPERAYEALQSVGIGRASVLVCAFDDDGDNLLLAMNAKRLNPNIKVLMATHDRNLAQSAQTSDVDMMLPIMDIVSQVLAQASYSQEVVGVGFKKGTSGEYPVYAEFQVEHSGTSIGTLSRVAPIIMIQRGGEVSLNPSEDTTLQSGDTVYIYTEYHSKIGELREYFKHRVIQRFNPPDRTRQP
ncbi:MAG: NAD-binding protein [Thermoprotei archaeon]